MGISLLGFICALAIERGKMRPLMISGLVSGAIVWAGWEYGLWFPEAITAQYSVLRSFCTAVTGWVVLMAFVGLLHQVAVPPGTAQHVRTATVVVSGCFFAFMAIALIVFMIIERDLKWGEKDAVLEFIGRVGGVFGVLTLAGTLAVLASSLVPRIGHGKVPESMRRDLDVTCPRCGRGQTIRSHGDDCGGCGLRIKVVPL
jgi:ribosomal protein S27AE